MAKKEKKQKPVLNLDDKEYVIEDMSDEQKQMINHINDYFFSPIKRFSSSISLYALVSTPYKTAFMRFFPS